MDEVSPTSESGPLPFTAPATIYKDRSTGLVVFGALTICLGLVCALFVPLMIFGQMMTAKTLKTPPNFMVVIPGATVYGVLAIALVWLGIGSTLKRRWSRALLLIFSWSWLVMGAITLVVMMFLMPIMLKNFPANTNGTTAPLPPGAQTVAMVVAFLIISFFFILIPAVWIFFYNSKHVKATCETRNPQLSWTDVCPLPVLGMCIWLMFSAATMLVMPLAGWSVLPFFGLFLSGISGLVFYVLMAAVWSLGAWWLYHLDQRGWWLILIGLSLFFISAAVTYSRHDLTEMYQLMGLPQSQIDQVRAMGLFTGNAMAWLTLLSLLPFVGYLLYIKRHFKREPQLKF